MKFLNLLLVSVSFLFVQILAAAEVTAEVDEILGQMERASDPKGIAKSVKSFTAKSSTKLSLQGITLNSEFYFKEPNLFRNVVEIPNIQKTTIIFDGEKGYTISQLGGVVEMGEKELEVTKAQAMLGNPGTNLREVFEKITLDETMEKDGRKYYRLSCTFKDNLGLKPVIIQVNASTFLIEGMEIESVSEMGNVTSVMKMEDYRDYSGFIMPSRTITKILVVEMIVTLEKFEINTKFPDSFFQLTSQEQKELNGEESTENVEN